MPARSTAHRSPLLQRGPGRPPYETLRFDARVFTAFNELWTHQYLTPSQIWRGLLSDHCCARTFDRLLIGRAKASPVALAAVAILGHALGLKSDEILIGKIVPPPDRALLLDRLRRLDQLTGTTFTSSWVQQRVADLTEGEGTR